MQPRPVAEDWDRRPSSIDWSSDGAALIVTADQSGRAPVFSVDVGDVDRHPAHRRRLRLHRRVAAPGGVLYALRSSYAAPPHPVRIDPDGVDHDAAVHRIADAARHIDRSGDHDRRRHDGAVMAGAARQTRPGPAAALGPRRPAGQLEQLGLALESVAAGGARVRGAAARSGAVDRLRTGLHPARLGRLGRTAIRRSDGGDRRGVCAPPDRRDPHRRDGRVVRRLHGQLDRGPHQPFRRDRHPRQPVGARPVRADHRHAPTTGAAR